MRSILIFGLTSALVLAGCGSNESGEDAASESRSPGSDPANALTDYLGEGGQAMKSAQAMAGLTSIDKAIQYFELEHDRKPASLQELVDAGHLSSLPTAPYQRKYVYDPQTGKADLAPVQPARE